MEDLIFVYFSSCCAKSDPALFDDNKNRLKQTLHKLATQKNE